MHATAHEYTYHFVFLAAEADPLRPLVHVEEGAHAVPRAVVVVQAQVPQRLPCHAVHAGSQGPLGHHQQVQRDVPLWMHAHARNQASTHARERSNRKWLVIYYKITTKETTE
jgi:hypothetical protein